MGINRVEVMVFPPGVGTHRGPAKPPGIPSGSLCRRADTYIHHFPDHWGRKAELKTLRDQLQIAAFTSGADTSVTEAKLTDALDHLDSLNGLLPWGPRGPDHPWALE
jgi:hypothetical protein